MATDERKPMVAVNTGRVVMVPKEANWVSEVVVKTTGVKTGE